MSPALPLPVGLVIATVSMSTGIGGGVLWTPFLILVMGMRAPEAVATALMIQILGQASGVAAGARAGAIDWKGVWSLVPICFPGLLLGVALVRVLPEAALGIGLGVSVLGISLLFVSTEKELRLESREDVDLSFLRRRWLIPATAPILTGLFSLGAGDWLVPFLEGRLKLRMQRAIGTSIALMLVLSTCGSLGHLLWGAQPRFDFVAWAAPGVLVGGQLGVLLARRIEERLLKEIFVFVLLLLGIHILFQSF